MTDPRRDVVLSFQRVGPDGVVERHETPLGTVVRTDPMSHLLRAPTIAVYLIDRVLRLTVARQVTPAGFVFILSFPDGSFLTFPATVASDESW